MKLEFDGKKYETASTHQKEWGSKIIEELNLQGTEQVLDLRCGDGTLTSHIADLLPKGEVFGIDASQSMLDTARLKQRVNLHFILMDINDLGFVEQFDVIFSNATLHWIRDHKRLLQNVRSALRKDGRLRFNFAGEGNCSHFFKVIREAMSKEEFARHFANFEWPWYMPGIDKYETLVNQSGLRDVRVWGENADRLFPDVETMTNWIDQPSLVPFLARVPEEHKVGFRDFTINRMIEETRREDGRCFETFRRVNVVARR